MARPDLEREARVALIDYHAADLMPAADRDAAWSRLQAAIAAGDDPITDADPPPHNNSRAWMIAALIAAAILLAVAGLETLAAPQTAADPQEAVHESPADTTTHTTALRRPPPQQPVPEDTSTIQAPPPQRPRPRPEADLDAELALLRSAREALAAHDFSAALARLDEHTRRFPRGHLAEERARLHVQALCSAGARLEARAAAESFARANPTSPHTPRLLRICTDDE